MHNLHRTAWQQKIFLLLLLVGFSLRLLWILFFPNDLYADSIWYYEQALNLLQGKGYVYKGAPSAIWPVGYPFFLSLVFRVAPSTPLIAKLVNVALLTLDLWLLFQYARRSVFNASASLVAVALLTFMPTYIFAASIVGSEPLFTALLHLGLLVLLLALQQQQDLLWLLAGCLAGLMTYVRAEAIVFLLIVLLFYGISKPAIWSTKVQRVHGVLLLIIAAPLLIIAPWTIRNYVALGLFVPISTTGCMNMWIGHAPGADGGFYWSPDPAANPVLLRDDDTEQRWYRRSCQAAGEAIRRDPLRALSLWPQKILKLWQNDRDMVHWNLGKLTRPLAEETKALLYTSANAYYYVVLTLGLLGVVQQLWRLVRLHYQQKRYPATSQQLTSVVGIVTVIGFTLIYLPFFGAGRFHFALTPLLAIYAGELLTTGIKRVSPKGSIFGAT
jgi:hypothetical protein